jgi:hypothetical protein
MGQCKLCLGTGVKLQDSHILPAGLYRMLYKASKAPNQTPWLVTKDVEVQTSKQEKAYMFCAGCEDRLNRHGEAWVFRNAPQPDGSYPLGSMVADSIGKTWPDVPNALYRAASIPRIKVSAIAYFAASIFWRASIHDWKRDFEAQSTCAARKPEYPVRIRYASPIRP